MSSAIANPTPQAINALLGKLTDQDPDFRFMSLNDLSQILASPRSDFLRQDYNTASRIVDAVIKTLDDQNGEVQNLAVRCIGPLAAKIQSSVVAPMFEKLTNIKLEHSVDASLPALALRSAISSLPKPVPGVPYTPEVLQTYAIISRVLVPRILGFSSNAAQQPTGGDGLFSKDSVPSAEAIDVLIEVVRCFGPLLQPLEVEKLQDVVVQVLERPNTPAPTKKRAVVALAVLATYLSPAVLGGLLQKIQTGLGSNQLPPIMRRLYINILGSLARSIPHQIGTHLPELMPRVMSALSQEELDAQLEAVSEGDEQQSIEFNEVREAALVALEAFLSSCGAEMRPFTDDIIAASLRYLKFDPNYAVDDDDDMEEDAEDDDGDLDDDDDYDDDGDFDGDDDDSSWKVRRCAAKTLYTLISTRSVDLLEKGTLYQTVATPLIKRCDEREESVRLEVISTLALLIRKTGEGVIRSTTADEQDILLQSLPDSRKRRRQSSGGGALSNKAPYGGAGVTSPKQDEVPESGPRADLVQLTPQVVKTSTKLLKGKQIATKQAIVGLLDDLISVQHGGLSDYFDQVMQPIIDMTKGLSGGAGSASAVLSGGAASATATTLRVAVLNFISDIAKTHSSSLFQSYLADIVAGVVSAVGDRFYKISSEAIRTAEELIKAITPPRAKLTQQRFKADLQSLYETIYGRAAASDADTEVRQKAIQALGTLLSRTSGPEGQALLEADKRQAGLTLLLDRLRNETTRLHAVRAIDSVAAHTVKGGSLERGWIQEVAIELCGQLRKANRSLRGSSIQALQHLILSPASKNNLDESTVNVIVSAILPVVAANDSHLLAPALNVLAQLQLENPSLIETDNFVLSICELLKKSLTGSALEALSALVINVGQTGKGAQLMRGVLQVGVAGDPAVVGRVAGTLFVASNGTSGVAIDSFVSELQNASKPPTPDTNRQSLALAILGEIGLRLGPNSPLQPELFLAQFKDEPDKASVSAAVALGRAGAGNVAAFLPVILEALEKQTQQQYLLLQSIREILQQVVVSATDISAYEAPIWQILFSASQGDDNKAICAECIGRLAIHEPKTYIPKLQELLKSDSPAFRAVAVQALRYTLPDSDEAFDAALKNVLVNMLLTVLQDQDMEIRRLAMTTLNSAAHNKPDLILPHLGQLVPFVMTESVIKPELIREVQMGPFKHKVDDGLEVRKSAYETLYALMETAFSRMGSLEFYNRVIAGLSDDNDIRSLCNLMLSKLIVIDPEETTRRLDTIAECYRKTLSTKLKDGAVKQEVEKQEEANKSVLRLSLLLAEKTKTTVPSTVTGGAVVQNTQNPIWQSYWEWINKDFSGQLKMLREENRAEA
ncbi:TATA-binding protein interacting [Microdochium bolleyi]|uniref:TATA-binding protein interacting n=1 Tax=Microdochium bolleyi TaxID=196109 RepID=A0A136J8P4_9PEZI|nr:TATA-binding protein interacting [Microdochium bolleyi]